MQGGNDDIFAIFNRLAQRRRIRLNRHDHATGLLELLDGVLQLFVEDPAVGNDDDAVEESLLRRGIAVKAGELVTEPGDGVGFAGTGAVLDQVVLPDFFRFGLGEELAHHVELMVTREDQVLATLLLQLAARAPDLLRRLLHMQVVFEQIEEGIGLEDVFPQVVGAETVRVDRIFGVLIEGEEEGLVGRQPGGHKDLFVADGEVDQAAFEAEERLLGVTVALVLFDRLFDELAGEGVFQFAGEGGAGR